jgi:hypothetical protein
MDFLNQVAPPPFEADDVNIVHLGQNFYAMKYPRSERVVVRTVVRLKEQAGIVAAVEFKKEGLRKKGSERIGSAKDLVKNHPKVPEALRLKGLDPMDYILIRFGPK